MQNKILDFAGTENIDGALKGATTLSLTTQSPMTLSMIVANIATLSIIEHNDC